MFRFLLLFLPVVQISGETVQISGETVQISGETVSVDLFGRIGGATSFASAKVKKMPSAGLVYFSLEFTVIPHLTESCFIRNIIIGNVSPSK